MQVPPSRMRVVLPRGCWGLVLLAAPGPLIAGLGGSDSHRARTVARVLGARHVAQAVFEAKASPAWRPVGRLVDAAHAASAVALAAADRRWRRIGFIDAAIATTFAAVGGIPAHTGGEMRYC